DVCSSDLPFWPSMAMSNWLPVPATVPMVKRWLTRDTWVPRPTRELAYTSANEAEDDLKPTVPELAILLPMMSRSCAAAFRPLSPCPKPMVYLSVSKYVHATAAHAVRRCLYMILRMSSRECDPARPMSTRRPLDE